jgi:hypothetical protein
VVVIPRITLGITDDLSFDDQPARLFPCLGLIADVRMQSLSLAGNGGKDTNHSHERFDLSFKNGIASKADQVFDMLLI